MTDQPRLAKSRLLVADAFTRHRDATTPPDPHEAAEWLLGQLENTHGWTPPRDPAEQVPMRPDNPAKDDTGPGRQAWLAAKAALAQRPRDTPPTTSAP